jgi:hypothetical protein
MLHEQAHVVIAVVIGEHLMRSLYTDLSYTVSFNETVHMRIAPVGRLTNPKLDDPARTFHYSNIFSPAPRNPMLCHTYPGRQDILTIISTRTPNMS